MEAIGFKELLKTLWTTYLPKNVWVMEWTTCNHQALVHASTHTQNKPQVPFDVLLPCENVPGLALRARLLWFCTDWRRTSAFPGGMLGQKGAASRRKTGSLGKQNAFLFPTLLQPAARIPACKPASFYLPEKFWVFSPLSELSNTVTCTELRAKVQALAES